VLITDSERIMSNASLSCSHEVRQNLKSFMKEKNLQTYDEALRSLLKSAGRHVDENHAESLEKGASSRSEKDFTTHQPLSYDHLSSSPETLTYLCGLTEAARGWLLGPLEEAVSEFFFFFFFMSTT
jgi:hypothetical protein